VNQQNNKIFNLLLLYIVVVSHHAYIFFFILSIPFVIIYAPWYIWVPLISWFLNATMGQGWICPYTAVENKIRKKVGLPQIDAFVKHYYIKPYIRLKIKLKKRNRKSLTN
jgi:polyferredoxin